MSLTFIPEPCTCGGWNILVMRDNGHDKFWAYAMGKYVNYSDEVRVRFGRIGTLGQETKYAADKIFSKIQEKFRKNYRKATAEEVEQLFKKDILLWEV
jgi:predicted DNA-binding WGR domain protein